MEDPAVLDLDEVALPDELEQVGSDAVDEWDAGGGEHEGSEVRVAAGGRGADVEHGPDLPLDQALCGQAVEILVVDQGDLTGLQPRDQPLGPPVGPDHPADGAGHCSTVDHIRSPCVAPEHIPGILTARRSAVAV